MWVIGEVSDSGHERPSLPFNPSGLLSLVNQMGHEIAASHGRFAQLGALPQRVSFFGCPPNAVGLKATV